MRNIMPKNSLPERFTGRGYTRGLGWFYYYRETMRKMGSRVPEEKQTDDLIITYQDGNDLHETTLGYMKARCWDIAIENGLIKNM